MSVGTDPDTAEFAVQTIRCWWRQRGSKADPEARELLMMADGGGRNGSKTRLWKVALYQDSLTRPESPFQFATFLLVAASGTESNIAGLVTARKTGAGETVRKSQRHGELDWEYHHQNRTVNPDRP